MATSIESSMQAEMTIRISDTSIINDVRRLLKHIRGIESITVRRKKCEIEEALKEAHAGKITKWDNVDDFFNAMSAK